MKSKLDLQSFTIIGLRSALDRRSILKGFGSPLTASLVGCSSDEVANDNCVDAGAGGALGKDVVAYRAEESPSG